MAALDGDAPMPARGGQGRIQLTILGGYLGSGKTTWLRHQLFEGRFANAHVIVNEAAETAVDDTLLQEHAGGMTLLAGGCACCDGRAELLAALHDICDRRSRVGADMPRLDSIVLETSGLADPAAIADAIQSDPVLVHHILLQEIIVLADASNVMDQVQSEQLGRAQIEAADRIILTKPDLVPLPVLSALYITIAQLNPGAEIEAAALGQQIFLDLDPGASPFPLGALDPAAQADPIKPVKLQITGSVDWASFSIWLSALLHARGRDIVRVKGVFDTPSGLLLLQGVRNSVQAPEILPPEAQSRPNQIVFIGRGFTLAQLEASLRFFSQE